MSFTTHYSVGPFGSGASAAPPANVLEACKVSTSTLEQDAFAQAEITFDYTKGRFPEGDVVLSHFRDTPTESIFGGLTSDNGAMAWEENGAWVCNPESEPIVTFQPGQSVAYHAWLLFPTVLTNEHPQMTLQDLNTMRWMSGLYFGEVHVTGGTTTGPQVGICGGYEYGGQYILPFAHFPFTASMGEHKVSCRHD